MSLASAFTTAWKDLKALGVKAETWIAKESPVVANVVKEVSASVEIVAPQLTPIISTFDSLEETVVGYVAALASDAANATTLSALFGTAWPTVQQLVKTLENHPAVVVAKTPSA